MRTRLWIAVACIAACGHHDETNAVPAPKPTIGSAAAGSAAKGGRDALGSAAGSATAPGPALPPARDLLAAIPADAAFAFVALEPSDVPKRLLANLDARTLREAAAAHATTPDPIARAGYAAWTELAAVLGNPDPLRAFGLGNRFAIYTVGAQVVARFELADPAATERVLARVLPASARSGPAWIVDGSARALFVAIAERQLVIARGPRAAIHAGSASFVGAAATPITEATLRELAKTNGFDPRGIGWIDPARIAGVLGVPGQLADFDALAPACRTELLGALHGIDRVALGVTELSAKRVGFALATAIAAPTATALRASIAATPSLPLELTGAPMVALTFISPPAQQRDSWLAVAKRVEAACGEDGGKLSPPWSDLASAQLVLYNVELAGKMPSDVDALVALAAPDLDAIAASINKAIPFAMPKDGGPYVDAKTDALFGLVPKLSIARRGKTLVAVTGSRSRSHVAELVPHEGAPLFRLEVDTARFRTTDTTRPDDDQFYSGPGTFSDEAGVTRAVGAVFGAFALRVVVQPAELRVTFVADARPPAPLARVTDPRTATRTQCIAILRKAFAATAPALEKLDVVDAADELAASYLGSMDGTSAIRSCSKLTAAERTCIAAAQVPQAAAAKCAPATDDHFHDSKLELPPLISFFGVDPIEPRMHPPVDPAPLLAKLRGTWVRETSSATETWVIDNAGNVVATTVYKDKEPQKTERWKLGLDRAGRLAQISGTSTSWDEWYMPDANTLFDASRRGVAVAPAANQFVVVDNGGYIVRASNGCWFVRGDGLLIDAKCTQTKDVLAVTYRDHDDDRTSKFTLAPGWVVSEEVTEHPFKRATAPKPR